MGLSRQEYWNGLPFPFPGDLPSPGIEATSPALAGRFFTTEPTGIPNVLWEHASAAAAKVLQLCLTLCDSIDGSPPGSPVPGTLQARTVEWIAISFFNA